MARGTADSFVDALQSLLEDIGRLLAAPDADVQFVMQLRDMVQGRLQQTAEQQAAAAEAIMNSRPAGMEGEMGAMPPAAGAPMPMQEAPTRLAPSSPDMRGATAELERALAGTGASGG